MFLLGCLFKPSLFCFPIAFFQLEVLQTLQQLPFLPWHYLVIRSHIKILKRHLPYNGESWSKMALGGPIFSKAYIIVQHHFYTYLYISEHVFMVYTFTCICWAGLSFVVIVTNIQATWALLPHRQLAVINVRHTNTIVCFYLFPKVCQTGKLLKEDFFFPVKC